MLIIIPLTIAAFAAAGFGFCSALRLNVHGREMLFAAAIALFASELAVLPSVLTRGSAQGSVAQAGLIGTVTHLFGCIALGGSAIVLKQLRLDPAFVYWLLAMYLMTLVMLSAAFVRAIRTAPVTAATGT